jgi:hypothetical protein
MLIFLTWTASPHIGVNGIDSPGSSISSFGFGNSSDVLRWHMEFSSELVGDEARTSSEREPEGVAILITFNGADLVWLGFEVAICKEMNKIIIELPIRLASTLRCNIPRTAQTRRYALIIRTDRFFYSRFIQVFSEFNWPIARDPINRTYIFMTDDLMICFISQSFDNDDHN